MVVKNLALLKIYRGDNSDNSNNPHKYINYIIVVNIYVNIKNYD